MSDSGNRLEGVRTLDGMDDVDRSGHAVTHVRYLDAAAELVVEQGVLDHRRTSYIALDLQPGDSVLDVGCGLGECVMALAEIVGAEGRVVGLDSSQTMIDEAKRRAEGSNLPVEFVVGNAYELPFADGTFTACREERMLQHLDDPSTAIAEMVRVTRSGGRVAVTNPDYELWAIDVPDRDLFRKLQAYRVDQFGGKATGWMGRQQYRLLKDAGLDDIIIQSVNIPFTDLAQANALLAVLDMADHARENGAIAEDEHARWHQWLHEADEAGRFFTSLGGFTVIGVKP